MMYLRLNNENKNGNENELHKPSLHYIFIERNPAQQVESIKHTHVAAAEVRAC